MQMNFDANTVPPAETREAVPEGWYSVVITESEMRPTRDQQGHYLNLTFKVIAGQYQGAVVYDRLNLHNSSEKAVEIAFRTLSSICRATGQMVIQDTQQLHNHPLEAKVTLREAGHGADGKMYPETNEIAGYRAQGSGGATGGGGDTVPAWAAPAAAAAPAAPAAPAWQPPQQAPAQQAPAQQPAWQPAWQPPAAAGAQATPPWAR